MISAIVYGRNDGYGYNLHKRCAISINCMAEVLDHPNDELIFVDYNSPQMYPTFPEAIADTLTDKAKRLLRVIRVPPDVHQGYFAHRTHLQVLEPISRNIALRRMNPKNRWVLSTNLDMVFVPLKRQSLSQVVKNLEGGFYGLPRFEMPERLWENVDRKQPKELIAKFGEWGSRLNLGEVVTVADDVGFDAPGDFQLCLKEDLEAIHGFHEEMIRGWHVDSNLFKRLGLYHQDIPAKDLMRFYEGYHCNHTFSAGSMHQTKRVGNDLVTFYEEVSTPYLRKQCDTWGLPERSFQEVCLTKNTDAQVLQETMLQLTRKGEAEQETFCINDKVDLKEWEAIAHQYDTEHVFPYLLNALTQEDLKKDFVYHGGNWVMQEKLRAVKTQHGGTLHIVEMEFSKQTMVRTIRRQCAKISQIMDTLGDVLLFIDYGLDKIYGHKKKSTDGMGGSLHFESRPRSEADLLLLAHGKSLLAYIFRITTLNYVKWLSPKRATKTILINSQRDHLLSQLTMGLIQQTQTPHTTRIRFGVIAPNRKVNGRMSFRVVCLFVVVKMLKRDPRAVYLLFKKLPAPICVYLRNWLVAHA